MYEAKVEFIKHRAAKSKFEFRLFALLSNNLAGNYMFEAPSIDEIYNRTISHIADLAAESQFKYANNLKVELSFAPRSIEIYSIGVSTNKKEKLCGFIETEIHIKNNTMPKKTPPVATSLVVENIPLDQIHASKSNPRKSFDKVYIQELADSMKPPIGLLQPITLRKNDTGYEIAFGECRYRAAKLLKWETIPALIKEIADDELLALQIIENLQREDVNPIDEAVAFKTLLKTENIEWLVSRIHKTKKYIVDRLKLNELIPEAITQVRAGILPIGHAVAISKLSFADQQKCLTKCIDNGFGENTDNDYCKVPLEELKDFIASDVMTDFAKVNFDPNDATLYEKAGACSNCPKRTCNNNLLFHDITKDDKCTDAACFQEKINLHVAREKERNKKQYGKVLSGEKDSYNSDRIKVQGVSVKYSETPTKNTIPVVITKAERYNRNTLGTTVYIDSKVLESIKTVKETKKNEGQTTRGGMKDYQTRQREEFMALWPKLVTISTLKNANDNIVKVMLKEGFSHYHKQKYSLALAGILGFNGSAQDPEQAYKSNEDGYSFEFMNEMFDKIIDYYGTERCLTILMLIGGLEEDEDYEIDDEEFGITFKQMMIDTGLEKPSSNKSIKKLLS